jgi:hypothetical protein
MAEGTSALPIVFTSNQAAGSRDYGDWGGIILCGSATINITGGEAIIEGGVGAAFGGGLTPNDDDNSGILKYVRIEFPGIAFAPNNEINGLTMGAVGRGTTLDYIQVSYSGDDSYEWFGGTVNAKHLIAFRGWDDDFDSDNGFKGMVQFAVTLRDPAVADVSGSNGFESDNDASGSGNTPFTQALFSNVSFYGPLVTPTTTINSNFKRGAHIRRNSKLNVYNSTFSGYPVGLYIDGNTTQANAIANDLKMQNCIMTGMGSFFAVPSGQTWTASSERTWYLDPSRSNDTLVNNSQLMITDPFNLSNPNFLPLAGSPVFKKSAWMHTLSGQLSYFNTIGTALNNSTVYLKNTSNVVLEQVNTNASGAYSFKVLDGTYNLSATTTKPWGGVNSSDALIVMKHFVGISPLTGLKLTCANVNGDGSVNSTDALIVQKRFVGTLSSFAAGDWAFETGSQVVSGADVVKNLKGLCYGDVNGSYTPSAMVEPSVSLIESGKMNATPGNLVDVPVSTVKNMTVGALSLVFNISDVVEITDVKVAGQDEVIYAVTDGQLCISWYAKSPVLFIAGETMIVLSLRVLGDAGNSYLAIDPKSEIADWEANSISGSTLSTPKLVYMNSTSSTVSSYPNPASAITNFIVHNEDEGLASIRIFNLAGEMVAVPYNGTITSGMHIFTYDLKTLTQGSYLYTLEINGVKKSTGKLIVVE